MGERVINKQESETIKTKTTKLLGNRTLSRVRLLLQMLYFSRSKNSNGLRARGFPLPSISHTISILACFIFILLLFSLVITLRSYIQKTEGTFYRLPPQQGQLQLLLVAVVQRDPVPCFSPDAVVLPAAFIIIG